MNDKKFIQIISKVFNIDQSKVDKNTNIKKLQNWDSLKAVSLLVQIEKNYNKKIPVDIIEQLETVNDFLISFKIKCYSTVYYLFLFFSLFYFFTLLVVSLNILYFL